MWYTLIRKKKERKTKMLDFIKNLSENALDYPYIVARLVEGDYWFYGAYNDKMRAHMVAAEIAGVVFYNT